MEDFRPGIIFPTRSGNAHKPSEPSSSIRAPVRTYLTNRKPLS